MKYNLQVLKTIFLFSFPFLEIFKKKIVGVERLVIVHLCA
jgi:hypothetical protein